MCKFVAKLSIFSIPAKKKSIFLSKNLYILYFPVAIGLSGPFAVTNKGG